MNSDYLRIAINSFDRVLLPAIKAGCGRKDISAALVFRANLDDILVNLCAWERTAGPDLPENVVALAAPVPAGPSWAFRDHRTQAEVMADERRLKDRFPPDGGDAA